MKIIQQKLLNFTISLFFCLFLSACQTTQETAPAKVSEVKTLTPPVEIAILMPMTGPHAALGKQYNTLLKMGLEDGIKTNIHVTSYDGADERQVTAAMGKIIARDTKIILGPLYSPLTSLIAPMAKENGIIILTMSNNPALADEKLIVFGHAPLKQLDRVVNHFLDKGYKNFLTLLPAGQHSQNITKIIQDMAIEKNATLVKSEYYDDQPESVSKAVDDIVAKVDKLNEIDDDSQKPVIYLADDQKNLHLVFGSIHKHSLDKKAILIGDNRLDIDYPEVTNIVFSGSLNYLNSKLVARSKEIGINHLSFMHLMAYDLGRLTSTYIGNNFTETSFLARIKNPEAYIGLSGNIWFVDSIAQRYYDIIQVDAEGERRTIDRVK